MANFSFSHWIVIGVFAALYWVWAKSKNRTEKASENHNHQAAQQSCSAAHKASLEDIFVDRNIDGIALEKSGQDEKAVALYELNLKDGFDGSHPYDRLRIFYSHKGMYDDAIRVCQAYINHGQERDLVLKAKYVEWIGKYKTRKEKQK